LRIDASSSTTNTAGVANPLEDDPVRFIVIAVLIPTPPAVYRES
jgi:hypothetical protein